MTAIVVQALAARSPKDDCRDGDDRENRQPGPRATPAPTLASLVMHHRRVIVGKRAPRRQHEADAAEEE